MSRGAVKVTCPACFVSFEVQPPPLNEVPAEWDYDCEVCCNPIMIRFSADEDEEILAEAHGLSE